MMAPPKTARGIRNHNPGNIDYERGTKWQGAATPPYELVDGKPGRFCAFTSPEWGIRAICRVLITYYDKHDLNTVRSIIHRWAPSIENDTNAYVKQVCKKLNVGLDDPIVVTDYPVMRALVEAIIKHENGAQPYPALVIDEGLRRAGVVPPAKLAIQKTTFSPEGIGSGGAGVGIAGSMLTEQAQQMQLVAPEGSQVMQIVCALLAVCGVLLTIYGLYKRTRSRSA